MALWLSQIEDTSFNMDCRIIAVNMTDQSQSLKLQWKASSANQASKMTGPLTAINDPKGVPFRISQLWGFEGTSEKGTEDRGEKFFSAAPHGNIRFHFYVNGMPTDVITLSSMDIVALSRPSQSSGTIPLKTTLKDLQVVGLNENPNSAENRLYRRYPILQRWLFLIYIGFTILVFIRHLGRPGFAWKVLLSYVLNTPCLCFLIYGSPYLMYWHYQNWQPGYEFSIFPITMNPAALMPGEIPKQTATYWTFLVAAVSLYVSFPQAVLYALGSIRSRGSTISSVFFKLARWFGVGACFLGVVLTLSSILNPYRSANWLLMLACCAAILGINRKIVKRDLVQGLRTYIPGGDDIVHKAKRVKDSFR